MQGQDSHVSRQAELEAEFKDIRGRLGSMNDVRDYQDFVQAMTCIRRSGKDLDGVSASVLDARPGDTFETLESEGIGQSKAVPEQRIYVVGHGFQSIHAWVYQGGDKVAEWTYNDSAQITDASK